MNKFLALLPVIFLAACGDPRQACISKATKNLAVVQGLIAQTELNIDRGYGVDVRTRNAVSTSFCVGSGRRNVGISFCNRSTPVERRVPVAIDLNAESEKLKSLRIKEQELTQERANAVQRCQLEYPAT